MNPPLSLLLAALAVPSAAMQLDFEKSIGRQPIRIAHVISPMPHMDDAQLGVLYSMARAKKFVESHLAVKLTIYLAQVEGEAKLQLPSNLENMFVRAPRLSRSTKTVHKCARGIPFPSDLMRTLMRQAPDAHIHVLSNADIGLSPGFYARVMDFFWPASGDFGLNILKVMIPRVCDGKPLAWNITRTLDMLKKLPQLHPGSDMFVWGARATPAILAKTGDVFFGYPPVGGVISDAIERSVRHFTIVKNEHLTFHFGHEGEHGRGNPSIVKEVAVRGCSYDGNAGAALLDAHDCDYSRASLNAAKLVDAEIVKTKGRNMRDCKKTGCLGLHKS